MIASVSMAWHPRGFILFLLPADCLHVFFFSLSSCACLLHPWLCPGPATLIRHTRLGPASVRALPVAA